MFLYLLLIYSHHVLAENSLLSLCFMSLKKGIVYKCITWFTSSVPPTHIWGINKKKYQKGYWRSSLTECLHHQDILKVFTSVKQTQPLTVKNTWYNVVWSDKLRSGLTYSWSIIRKPQIATAAPKLAICYTLNMKCSKYERPQMTYISVFFQWIQYPIISIGLLVACLVSKYRSHSYLREWHIS